MKKLLRAFVFFILTMTQCVFASNFNALFTFASQQLIPQRSQLLYVLYGKKGKIQKVAGKKNNYIIYIKQVSPSMTYFSNRPQHIAGTLTTSHFFNNWSKGKDSFASNPPNAALTATVDGKHIDEVFELEKPHYNKSTNTLVIRGKLINGNQFTLNKNLNNINLFIDFHWHNNTP